MNNEKISDYNCTEGIFKLHDDLSVSFKKAKHISDLAIPKTSGYIDAPKGYNEKICIYLDAQENKDIGLLDDYIFCGNFIFDKVIHRFLKIKLDFATISGIKDQNNPEDSILGIPPMKLMSFLRKGENVVIVFYAHRKAHLFNTLYRVINMVPCYSINFTDDVGKPFKITDVDQISIHPVPETLLNKEYDLVGVKYYAPYTTSEAFCILYAQIDNEYDVNAIKVLRWFPQPREHDEYDFWGEDFFELGFISRNDNTDLHNFMIENNSRILFATKKDNKIKIMGGFDVFFCNNFIYPQCFSKIKIL